MDSKRITYIHIFIWLFAIFANLPYSVSGKQIDGKFIVSNTIGFLYLMFVFYLFYTVLVPAFLNKNKLAEFFAIAFFTVLIMPFFGYTILFFSRALFDGTFSNFYGGYSVKTHMSGYYPVLTAAVFGSFFSLIINWFSVISQKNETDKQKLAVELDLLKSKLNPHFLFNTLNNIDSLINQDPDKASSSLIRLSEIMRYLTYETSPDVVELGKEVDYISNFIELYKIRIKQPEDISFEINADYNIKISPALFVPLLENAFKFAVYGHRKPVIDIQLFSEGSLVKFSISNYYNKHTHEIEKKNSGYGIPNLKKRLELIYPFRHNLVINDRESLYTVKLTIETHAN